MRWHDERYPRVTRTNAGSDDARLRHRHPTLVPRPPAQVKDPLGLPQHPGRRNVVGVLCTSWNRGSIICWQEDKQYTLFITCFKR